MTRKRRPTLLGLLSSAHHWVKGFSAVNNNGKRVSMNSPKACRWCLSGAVDVCYPPPKQVGVLRKLEKVIRKYTNDKHEDVALFNDHYQTRFKDVVAVIKLAGLG